MPVSLCSSEPCRRIRRLATGAHLAGGGCETAEKSGPVFKAFPSAALVLKLSHHAHQAPSESFHHHGSLRAPGAV
jgi:hypothetical protein